MHDISKKVLKASNAKNAHEIFADLAKALALMGELEYIKIYTGRIVASNALSEDRQKKPVTEIGKDNIVGVELLIDVSTKVIQFYSLTSTIKGCGQKIVSTVLDATPEDWEVVVLMDWSEGFWQVMADRFPRLRVG